MASLGPEQNIYQEILEGWGKDGSSVGLEVYGGTVSQQKTPKAPGLAQSG